MVSPYKKAVAICRGREAGPEDTIGTISQLYLCILATSAPSHCPWIWLPPIGPKTRSGICLPATSAKLSCLL